MEKIQFLDFENCVRLTNGEIEIIASTDFGPRILAYNYIGGENVLGIHANSIVETALGTFKPYGGHRLWIAPENMPNSYAPDNSPVKYNFEHKTNSIHFTQPLEIITQTQKEITISLDERGTGVRVHHKITNLGGKDIEIAAWALTIMRGSGEVLIPNEPFSAYGAETLLPVRNLTVWSYTDLSDPRWKFDSEFIRLKVDPDRTTPQKIGVLNKHGWIKYQLADILFTKRFEYIEQAVYPDLNSNTEIYCAGNFIEIETLTPLKRIAPGKSIEHYEYWNLNKS